MDSKNNKIIEIIEARIDYLELFKKAHAKKTAESKTDEDFKIDNVFYNVEISFLYNEIIFFILILKELGIDMSDKIREVFKEISSSMYKRKFHLQNGEIIETTEGFLQESRESMKNSPLIKNISKTLEDSLS